jgi:hypothetical protein
MPSASLSRDFLAAAQQRLAVARMVGSPLAIAAQAGFTPYDWQEEILRSSAQTLLINCSRQAGKSLTTAMLIVAEFLRPDSTVVIITPSLRQSRELMRKVLRFWRKLGRPIPHVAATRSSLELVNGSRVEAFPANSDTIRGISSVTLLVVDEAAMVPEELYDAVTPMLAAVNGRLVALSTPKGQRGWWYELWKTPAAEDPDIERVEVPATKVLHFSEKFLARERRRKPATFDQEFMCKFLDDERQAFRTEDIEAAQVEMETWDWALELGESA